MPISAARKRANDKYLAKLEPLPIRVPLGRKAEIQALAAAQGKSLNQYVVDAIDEQEGRDRAVVKDYLTT